MKIEEAIEQKLTGPKFTFPIERGKVREFARAVGVTDAEYLDDLRAPVPATFLTTAGFFWGYTIEEPGESVFKDIEIDRQLLLHAGEEVEFFGEPPRIGDMLTGQSMIQDGYEKISSTSGRLQFIVMQTDYNTDTGRLVARQRTTLVNVERTA
ncbi:MAG: MaoC family dehydratase N-terminal domain-containing protein [Pseudomonadota bacterium]